MSLQPPNWQEVEKILFEKVHAAILQFAEEHHDETCSFFAFQAEPIEGRFRFCFDTPENAIKIAINEEQRIIKKRRMMLAYEWSWKNASLHTDFPRIVDYSFTTEYFTYSSYNEFLFSHWLDFVDSAQYPKSNESEDDYLEGSVRIVIWKVTEQLIKNNVFARLHLTSPYRIGYQLYDNELVVLRLLNWSSI